MLSALAQEFQKLVSTQVVVRVKIDRYRPSSRYIDCIDIELLVRDADQRRITRLMCQSTLPRTRYDRHSVLGQLRDEDFREDYGRAWDELIDEWAKTSANWDEPAYFVAVNLLGDKKRSISPGHPFLLQEFARIKVLLDQRIRGRRGPQSEYVQAYRLLGHLIEAQNKAWSAVYPL